MDAEFFEEEKEETNKSSLTVKGKSTLSVGSKKSKSSKISSKFSHSESSEEPVKKTQSILSKIIAVINE